MIYENFDQKLILSIIKQYIKDNNLNIKNHDIEIISYSAIYPNSICFVKASDILFEIFYDGDLYGYPYNITVYKKQDYFDGLFEDDVLKLKYYSNKGDENEK